MKRGLVIGKFYPPHLGHCFLIETALRAAEQVTVVVCDRQDQRIPGALRARWLARLHPSARVIVVEDIGRDDDSRAWAEYTRRFLGWVPDAVFSSEDYGDGYARALGCEHVLVDLERTRFPVSASQIRADPMKGWAFLPPPVRAYFARRVCVLGTESTGTTTLARALAAHYQTVWVPEFGRLYSEGKGGGWETSDFVYIAEAQNGLEDRLAERCNRILICDTDSLATRLWHERYLGSPSPEVTAVSERRTCDLYLLTDVDVPFVQDGTRDGEQVRHWMHERFLQELAAQQVPWILVSGPHAKRLMDATAACDALLGRPWEPCRATHPSEE